MKKLILTGFLIAAVSIFMQADPSAAKSVADYPAGMSASGIASSRHNLGAWGRVITTTATTEICIFCHTPHHANSSEISTVAPLWNRAVNAGGYVAYGATLSGNTVSASDIGGATLACLSCHDGTITFDNLVNMPGKGGVVPGGSDRGFVFKMPQLGESVDYDHFDKDEAWCIVCHGVDNGFIMSLDLDENLTDDHPVSVVYQAGGAASLRDTTQVIGDINLTGDLIYNAAKDDEWTNLAQNRWAVGGFISDEATVGELLRNGKVECSSCHDPHFRNLSWDEVEDTWWVQATALPKTWCTDGEDCSDGLFLRRVGGNTGSGVCRTCHEK
jgi:hypothetical protein